MLRMTQLSGIDLNLLVVLSALLEEGGVTSAARRLNQTPSGVSRALARLRVLLDDELFVRTGRGLTPTQRAEALAAPLAQLLAEVERLVTSAPTFDPASSDRRFRIAGVDYVQAALLGPMIARFADEAPHVEIELHHRSPRTDRELDAGTLDLSIYPRHTSSAGVVWTPLYAEDYVCLVAADHPARRLTPKGYAALDHVLVAPRGERGGVVDDALAELEVTRRVSVLATSFLMVPHLLVGTARVAAVPRRWGRYLAANHPLRVLRAPVEIRGFTMSMGWHEIFRNDPAHRWLRTQVARAVT